MIKRSFKIAISIAKALSRDLVIQRFRIKARLVQARVLRGFYYRGDIDFLTNINLGIRLVIDRSCTIWMGSIAGSVPELSIGDDVYIGERCYIGCGDNLSIGKNCLIGASSYIIDCNHRFERRDIPVNAQGFKSAPICISDDVWIGAHCVVLSGVTIGKGAIVGAGSLVNKSIPGYEIWGGVPAKKIGMRTS